jgi:exodeoxyribonuclease V alpha subunit
MSDARGSDDSLARMEGVVERIVFSNPESGYVIAELRPERGLPVTVKGVLPGLRCGESVQVEGRMKNHPSFGPQIEAENFSVRMPAGVEALKKFLSSGLVPGIGKGYAQRIVAKFGADTPRVLSEGSGRLREIAGLGAGRAAKIKAAWDEQVALREVMIFLQSYGVGVRRCMRIVKQYGGAAPAILKNDPYALARDVDGIGFATADRIALNMGLGSDSPRRVEAGLVYCAGLAGADGHTALPGDVLVDRCVELLRCARQVAEDGLGVLLSRRSLVSFGALVQLPVLARSEDALARDLRRIAQAPSALPDIKAEDALEWAGRRVGFAFAPEQREAVLSALSSRLCVITGGPGTGKTSILRALVDILRAKKLRVVLASPTGRAAQRLAASAGVPASTLHRLLRYKEEDGAQEGRRELEADVVIVDEASMLDVRLGATLAASVPSGAHLVLVGDADQLPSVGPGNVLADVIGSGVAAVVRLKRVFRQGDGSAIVDVAGRILEGNPALPPLIDRARAQRGPLPEVSFLPVESPEQAVGAVVMLCSRWQGEGVGLQDMQVLSPMHKGRSGIAIINGEVRKALVDDKGERLSDFSGQIYGVGDKVICTRNNYDKFVFNGDMGIVSEVNQGECAITVSFPDSSVVFSRMELVDLAPAYAVSIHKSQGSEFENVAIVLMPEHLVLLRRNLLYTAITRARKCVVIVGRRDAWAKALSESRAVERCTTLHERMRLSPRG